MTEVLVLSKAEVEACLDLGELLEAVAAAMRELSDGRAVMPARVAARAPDGILASMLAWLPGADTLACKLVSVYPGNGARGLPSHHAIIAVFDPATGAPVALLDGEAITASRTAAGSALATKLLARADANVLTVIGTGVQARSHLAAVPRVMPALRRVVVAGRDVARAERLATESAALLGVEVVSTGDIEAAVREAGVVCACTHAADPVVRRAWLADGTHVCSVGVNLDGVEVDAETVAASLVVVESCDAALGGPGAAGSNDLAWPIRDGLISADHVSLELGNLVSGKASGRRTATQITLYKSVGVAVQDAAAASLVLRRASAAGFGSRVEL